MSASCNSRSLSPGVHIYISRNPGRDTMCHPLLTVPTGINFLGSFHKISPERVDTVNLSRGRFQGHARIGQATPLFTIGLKLPYHSLSTSTWNRGIIPQWSNISVTYESVSHIVTYSTSNPGSVFGGLASKQHPQNSTEVSWIRATP